MLRVRPHGESDKIVTLLTRDFGKLSGIAKGALKSRRRFVASLEPFTQIRLDFRTRAQATDLCFIESAEIVRSPRSLGRDLDRYAYSTYVLEVADCMVEGREADARVFELVEETLAEIDRSFPKPLRPEWLRRFELHLLALTGLEPRIESCARCSRRPESGRFNPRTGSLLCDACADDGGMVVSSPAVEALRALRDCALDAVPVIPREVAGELRVWLQTFIGYHARRPLRSPGLLREILGR